jgi:hypothetical protein
MSSAKFDKVRKNLRISRVIVTPGNVRELAKIIIDEYNKDLEKLRTLNEDKSRQYYDQLIDKSNEQSIRDNTQQHYEEYSKQLEKTILREVDVRFVMKTVDDTQYESAKPDIFNEGGYLETKRVQYIEMSYRNLDEIKGISVELSHNKSNHSIVNIYACDEIWANGVFKGIDDAVFHWKKQVYWPYKYIWVLLVFYSVSIALSLTRLMKALTKLISTEELSQSSQLMIYICGIILSTAFWTYLNIKIRDLYPVVEFAMGPEYLRFEQNKRKQFGIIITSIISPLLLALLYDLIKPIFDFPK